MIQTPRKRDKRDLTIQDNSHKGEEEEEEEYSTQNQPQWPESQIQNMSSSNQALQKK